MQNLIITKSGKELMSKLLAKETTASFTSLMTSSHTYTAAEVEALTELADVKQTSLISSSKITTEKAVEVMARFDNLDVAEGEGYYINALGVTATDAEGNSYLYAVSLADDVADYMPEYSGIAPTGYSYTLTISVSTTEAITLTIDTAAVPTVEQVSGIESAVTNHTGAIVYGEAGVHGFRYYNDLLQVQNDSGDWVDIETGGGGIAPSNVSDAKCKVGNGKLTIFWSDPGDTVIEGQTICTWKGTKLVQKAGSYPESVKDGTLLLDNQTLDAYKDNGFEINGLVNGQTYYFGLFPYSDKGAVNVNESNRLSGTPQAYRTMTVKINLANTNPATCCSYADDAESMTKGSSDWDDFFGHYPVLFKNGVEAGKLNPNNFSQFADGTSADITSGSAGDVMIAFPRRGLKISKSGSVVTVSMTDDPNNSDFEYNAHTRGSSERDVFYLGAYKGYTSSSKLRSLSGKTPSVKTTIGSFRTYAQNNGSGYEQSGFYQLTYRQCMYLLKYANLNSQSAVGQGYTGGSAAVSTGGTNSRGMDYGTTSTTQQVKLFGLEDFWGNVYEWIDGLYCDSSYRIWTGNDGFNNTGSGYANNGAFTSADTYGYMSNVTGTTKTGFNITAASGSSSTYFSDYATLYAGCLPAFGGCWSYGTDAGAFFLDVDYSASYSDSYVGARLMYL